MSLSSARKARRSKDRRHGQGRSTRNPPQAAGAPLDPRARLWASAPVGVSLVEADLRADHRRREGRDGCRGLSLEKENRESLKSGANIDAAKVVGKLLAERAVAKGIKAVVFDRGAYMYHGRVKALAEGAREGGLDF